MVNGGPYRDPIERPTLPLTRARPAPVPRAVPRAVGAEHVAAARERRGERAAHGVDGGRARVELDQLARGRRPPRLRVVGLGQQRAHLGERAAGLPSGPDQREPPERVGRVVPQDSWSPNGLADGSPGVVLLPPAVYLVVTTVQNNVVSPLAYGRELSLNAAAILVATAVAYAVWGAGGAVLAVPIPAAVRVVATHVGALKPAAVRLDA